MARPFPIPVFLLVLDGVGTLLLVLGILGAVGIDIGFPILLRMWPFFVVLGVMLMAPMLVWAVRRGIEQNKNR